MLKDSTSWHNVMKEQVLGVNGKGNEWMDEGKE